MDPIKPLGQILRALRSNKTSGNAATSESGVAAATVQEQPSSKQPEEKLIRLEALLRMRLANGDNQRSARRAFVETVLLSELGEELATDPGFDRLLDQVTDEIAGDRETATELDDYLALLQR